jgi:hypothetical protein
MQSFDSRNNNPYNNRIQLSSEQRKEIQAYLGVTEILNEYTLLKLIRKLKQIEQKLDEKKYG